MISQVPAKRHADVPYDLTAQLLTSLSMLIAGLGMAAHPVLREERRIGKIRVGREELEAAKKSPEKRCFVVDLWFQMPSLMMRKNIYHHAVAVCSYPLAGSVFVSHRPPKGWSLHIPVELIYINCLGHFYFSCTLVFI